MKEIDRITLKKYFETGDRPTEDHFVQLIESFVNKADDKITVDDDSQNIGIGTTTPTAKLDVAGDVKTSGKLTVGENLIVIGNLDVQGEMRVINTEIHQLIQLGDQPEDKISIFGTLQSSDDVSSPIKIISPLNVTGDITSESLNVSGDSILGAADQTTTITINSTLQSGADALTIKSKGNTANTFGLKVQNSDGVDQLSVRSDGNIGIGISEPEYKLDVNGTIRATVFSGDGSALTNLNASEIKGGVLNATHIPDVIDINQINAKTADGLKLFDSGNEGIFIEEGGNVGIATLNPSEKLEVIGVIKAEAFKGSGVGIIDIDASNITSGTLSVNWLPEIDTGKITTGIFLADRIPELNASKITEGTLSVDRLPEIDASNITSGIIAVERLPEIDSSTITGNPISNDMIPDTLAVSELFASGPSGLKLFNNDHKGIIIEDGGNVGIETKLFINGGTNTSNFHTVTGSLEINNAGIDTAILQANGITAPYRISIQDGLGRANHLWNAYSADAKPHQYDVAGEGAAWLRIHGGTIQFRTAPGGIENNEIPFNLGLSQNENGEMGIGTTDPKSKLDVAGTITAEKYLLANGNELSIGSGVWKKDNANIYYKEGNVGIGTATPERKLHIEDATNQGEIRLTHPDGVIGDIGTTNFDFEITTQSNHPLNFLTNGLQRMSIAADGNVGVGTIKPTEKLEINGAIKAKKVITKGVITGSSLPPNLVRNSFMNLLSGNKPDGFVAYGNVILEAVHPFTKGFEGPYLETKPASAAASVDEATSEAPYWFGMWNKGSRAKRGGLGDGWQGFGDGSILKITGDNKGGMTKVSFPFEKNVLTNTIRFKAWIKIVSGSKVGFGTDSGHYHIAQGLVFKKEQTDAAIDGWYQIDSVAEISQVTDLTWNSFSMGIEPVDGSRTFEVYLALPYVAVIDDNTWLPSVSDMLSRDGLTIRPETGYVGIGTTNPEFLLHVEGGIYARNSGVRGSDYAEYFKTKTGKTIASGTSVYLENGLIRTAKKGEVPFGVISANPGVVGGVHVEWPKKFLRDDFGSLIMKNVEEEIMVPKTEKTKKEGLRKKTEIHVLDENGNTIMVGSGKFETKERPKLNPKYDPKREYILREKRPEWNCVGLLGQLPLRKGQPVASTWVKIKDISKDVELWLVK